MRSATSPSTAPWPPTAIVSCRVATPPEVPSLAEAPPTSRRVPLRLRLRLAWRRLRRPERVGFRALAFRRRDLHRRVLRLHLLQTTGSRWDPP